MSGVTPVEPEMQAARPQPTHGAGAMSERAKELVTRQLETQKQKLTSSLDALAGQLERAGDGQVSQVASSAAHYMRRAAGTLKERSAEELVREVSEQIKERPGILIGAFFALGFLSARLIRS